MPEFANPTIALGVKPAQPAQMNAFDLMGKVVGIQSGLLGLQQQRLGLQQTGQEIQQLGLQIKGLQLGLEARTRAGEIMAQAPSLEEGIKGLQTDPLTSSFASEIAQTWSGTNQALTAAAGMQQEQAQSGLAAAFKSMGGAIANPEAFDAIMQAQLAAMSPQARASVQQPLMALKEALFSNLPSQPEDPALLPEWQTQAREVYGKNLAGLVMGSGAVSPDSVWGAMGTPAPSISMQPVGEGGAAVPVQMGGFTLGGAQIAGQQQAPVQGLTPQEQATQESFAASNVEAQKQYSSALAAVPAELKRVNKMVGLLGDFESGGGAMPRMQVAQFLQGLQNIGFPGITDEVVDQVSNGDLAATQAFDKYALNVNIQQLAQSQSGLGRAVGPELQAAMDQLSINKDPAALKNLLETMRWGMQLEYGKAQDYFKYKKAIDDPESEEYGLALEDFPIWWDANRSVEPPPEFTSAGEPLGEIPAGEIIGLDKAKPAAAKPASGKKTYTDAEIAKMLGVD